MSTVAVKVSDKLDDKKCSFNYVLYVSIGTFIALLLVLILYIDVFALFGTTVDESIEKIKTVTWIYGGIALVLALSYGGWYMYRKHSNKL